MQPFLSLFSFIRFLLHAKLFAQKRWNVLQKVQISSSMTGLQWRSGPWDVLRLRGIYGIYCACGADRRRSRKFFKIWLFFAVFNHISLCFRRILRPENIIWPQYTVHDLKTFKSSTTYFGIFLSHKQCLRFIKEFLARRHFQPVVF